MDFILLSDSDFRSDFVGKGFALIATNKETAIMTTQKRVMKPNSKAIAYQIERLQVEYLKARRQEEERAACNQDVVDRLNRGWYVVVSDTGCWWCHNSKLQEICEPDEMQALRHLEREGYVKQSES